MISTASHQDLLDGVDVLDVGSGPVVALAHGAGGGVRENFAPLFDGLGDHRRFVGPYYPGAGGTALSDEPLSVEQLADQVVAAAVRAGAERFPIVGLSLGGAVAVTAAARHPEHVSALVLTVPLRCPDAQARAVVSVWRALADAGDYEGLANLLFLVAASPRTLTEATPTEAATTIDLIRDGYPVGGSAHAELVTRVDVTPLLETITVPTLVVVAGADRILLPDTVRGCAAIRGAEVVEYPDAGHIFTPVEAQRWTSDVDAFLSRV